MVKFPKIQWPDSVLVAVLTAVYFLLCRWGLSLAVVHASATAVWPGTGLAFAVLLLWGYRLWPGVFLGAFLTNAVTSGFVFASIGIAAGNTLEALLAVFLMQRFGKGRRGFYQVPMLFRFVVFSAVAAAVGATSGVTSLLASGQASFENFRVVWVTWWLGDFTSAAIFAPFLVVWAGGVSSFRIRAFLEAVFLGFFVLMIGQIVFGGWLPYQWKDYSLTYLTALPVVWTAFRFQQRGAVTASLFLSAVAVYWTLKGMGPYALDDPNESLLVLQTFMSVISIAGLILASIVAENRRSHERLTVQYTVAQVLAESKDISDAAPRLLKSLCDFFRWEFGGFWVVSHEEKLLRCMAAWHRPSARLHRFEEESFRRTFAQGVGLPGRVWLSGKPAWIADVVLDSDFPRAPLASQAGLRGGAGFPVSAGGEVLGVVEFFSRHIQRPDEEFLQILSSTGNQVGQFLERKRAEERLKLASEFFANVKLQQSEERFRLMVDNVLDYAIIMLDADGRVVSWNKGAERIKGYAASEIIGKHFSVFFDEEDRRAGRPAKELEVASRIGKYTEEGWRVRKDGLRFWASVVVTALKEKDGKLRGFAKITRDMTEAKKTQGEIERAYAQLERRVEERTRELSESNRELEQFAYVASHDLQEPLRKVIAFSDRLKERLGQIGDPTDLDYFERIQNAAMRMKSLIEDLLHFSRITAKEGPFERAALEPIVKEAVSDLEMRVTQTRAKLDVGNLPTLTVNPFLMRQLFQNLIGNSIKFAKKDVPPQIQIRAEERSGAAGRFWEIVVRDNGIGFEEKYVDRIFKPFQRLHGRTEYEGTGIGLAVCQKIMQRHGGQITARSKPGEGAVFLVTFPVAE